MRIVGFLQVRNEVTTGHLDRFLKINMELLDALYVIDDGSDDGTVEALEAAGAVVIRNSQSNFMNEISNKRMLLERLKESENPGTGILWLDADEVLFTSREELHSLTSSAFVQGFDSVSLNHLNLWRSESFHRLDDNYASLKPTRLWKLKPELEFPEKSGLHSQTHPNGLISTFHSDNFPVVHFGFASLELIAAKYAHYFKHWQSGYALERLLSESSLELESLEAYPFKIGDRWSPNDQDQFPPKKLSPLTLRLEARRLKFEVLRSSTPRVTIICLIFKSTTWLEFAYGEALRLARQLPKGDVDILFVANDPSQEVSNFLIENRIPHVTFSGRKHPDEWYINSVYRAYNFGVASVKTDYAYLINSDMAFHDMALRNAMAAANKNSFIATRLVERGRLATGLHGLEKDFGSEPKNFRRRDFQKFASSLSLNQVEDGGLFMPLLVHVETFGGLGGFPEGNVLESEITSYLEGQSYKVASKGDRLVPGDKALMMRAALRGVSHKTLFNSLAYHFQEGELKHRRKDAPASGFLISNDLIQGVNGEETLWVRLVKKYSNVSSSNVASLENPRPNNVLQAALAPLRLAYRVKRASKLRRYRVYFSNATYFLPIRAAEKNLFLLQDRPMDWGLRTLQKYAVKRADKVLTNDLEYFHANMRKRVSWVQLASTVNGVPARSKLDSERSSELRGVFVGSFNSTKGVELLATTVLANPEVQWTLVSKYPDDGLPASLAGRPGVEILRKIPQPDLFNLVKSADFLVGTSPWETQHLASIEAVQLGVPVYLTTTGLLGYQAEGFHEWGGAFPRESYLQNFRVFLSKLNEFSPSEFAESLALAESDLYLEVDEVLESSFVEGRRSRNLANFFGRVRSYVALLLRQFFRYKLVPTLLRIARVLTPRRAD